MSHCRDIKHLVSSPLGDNYKNTLNLKKIIKRSVKVPKKVIVPLLSVVLL